MPTSSASCPVGAWQAAHMAVLATACKWCQGGRTHRPAHSAQHCPGTEKVRAHQTTRAQVLGCRLCQAQVTHSYVRGLLTPFVLYRRTVHTPGLEPHRLKRGGTENPTIISPNQCHAQVSSSFHWPLASRCCCRTIHALSSVPGGWQLSP